MKKFLNKNKIIKIIATLLLIATIVLATMLYQKNKEYEIASVNEYSMSFYELVDYVDNVKTYLAKSLISTTPERRYLNTYMERS